MKPARRYTVSGANGILKWCVDALARASRFEPKKPSDFHFRWVNGRLVGEASRPLVAPQSTTFTNTYVGRSNWGNDAMFYGNVYVGAHAHPSLLQRLQFCFFVRFHGLITPPRSYFFSALNAALTPDQVNAKSSQLLAALGRPPVASLGDNVRFVRVKR